MASKVELTPEVQQAIQDAVRDEVGRHFGRRPDWSRARVATAMQSLEERRRKIALPPEVVEEIIEEHRREFGRGPLVDNEEAGLQDQEAAGDA